MKQLRSALFAMAVIALLCACGGPDSDPSVETTLPDPVVGTENPSAPASEPAGSLSTAPVESVSAETAPEETGPVETQPTESQPTETQPSATAPAVEAEQPAHTHSYTAYTVMATCTESGYDTHSCSCGSSYTDHYVNALGHSYESVVTAPAVGAAGYTTHTCKNCGDVYTDSYTDALAAETEPETQPVTTEPAPTEPAPTEPAKPKEIIIWTTDDGLRVYEYSTVRVIDSRTWGEPPYIRITEEGGFAISYINAEGISVDLILPPVEGYISRCAILEDGSYKTSLIGDFSD